MRTLYLAILISALSQSGYNMRTDSPAGDFIGVALVMYPRRWVRRQIKRLDANAFASFSARTFAQKIAQAVH